MTNGKKIIKIVLLIFIIGAVMILSFTAGHEFALKRMEKELPKLSFDTVFNEKNLLNRLDQFCILDKGKKFNDECEGKTITINNLYLYPLEENEALSDGMHFYTSDSFRSSLNSISGDVLLKGGTFITAWINDNKELFQDIEDKAKSIKKPIPVSIKGTIESSEMCTQDSPCYYGYIINLKEIFYK